MCLPLLFCAAAGGHLIVSACHTFTTAGCTQYYLTGFFSWLDVSKWELCWFCWPVEGRFSTAAAAGEGLFMGVRTKLRCEMLHQLRDWRYRDASRLSTQRCEQSYLNDLDHCSSLTCASSSYACARLNYAARGLECLPIGGHKLELMTSLAAADCSTCGAKYLVPESVWGM